MTKQEIQNIFTKEFTQDPTYLFDVLENLPSTSNWDFDTYQDQLLLEYNISYENYKNSILDKLVKDYDLLSDLHIKMHDRDLVDKDGNIDLALFCEVYENLTDNGGSVYYDSDYHIFYDKYIHDTNDWRN